MHPNDRWGTSRALRKCAKDRFFPPEASGFVPTIVFITFQASRVVKTIVFITSQTSGGVKTIVLVLS